MTDAKNVRGENRLGEIAIAFLRLGFIAFGGAVAHIALMEEEFVRRRGWLSREEFVDRLGAVNLLPGPSSTEMAIYLGQLRGGFLGLLIAGAGFILPSALMMCTMAWAYLRYGALPQIAGVLWGVKPVVVVLIAQAVWSLGKTVSEITGVDGDCGDSAGVGGDARRDFGAADWYRRGVDRGESIWAESRWADRNCGCGGECCGRRGGLGDRSGGYATGVFAYFLKIGALLFGSGYVLLAVLREDLVARMHWLSESQLLGRNRGEPGHAGTVFYSGDIFGICAFGMARRRVGDGGDVYACFRLCCGHGQCFTAAEKIADGERVPGWSKRGGGGVDGVCGTAICARGRCDAASGGDCGH